MVGSCRIWFGEGVLIEIGPYDSGERLMLATAFLQDDYSNWSEPAGRIREARLKHEACCNEYDKGTDHGPTFFSDDG